MIQGVLFDLFDTLVTESTASVRRASSLASELSLNEDAYRRHWRSRRPDVVLGRSTFRDTLAQITLALGGTPDERLLDDLRSERLSQKAAVMREVEPDVLAAVEALRRRGLRLALVTNSLAEDVAGWDSSPLHPFFEVTLFSCVVGLAKPDSRIYCSRVGSLTLPLLTRCSSATVRTTSWLARGVPVSQHARRSGSWRDGSPQPSRPTIAAFGVLLTSSPPQRQPERPTHGASMLNLDGVTMFVSSTAANGVVGSDTRLHFSQKGRRVAARYAGGNVARGWLIGTLSGAQLVFRYAQREVSGAIHDGHSVAHIECRTDGRIRIVEHFTWSSRPGSGTNVFDELSPEL